MPFIEELTDDIELTAGEFDYLVDDAEYRYASFEQQDGRTLIGTALRYGDVSTQNSTGGPERMEPGVFGDVANGDVILDMMHVSSRPLARTGAAGGLILTDSPESLQIAATLPETRDGDDALRMVEAGILRGFSPMFYPLRDRMEGNTRVISRAYMPRIGLVATPAYDDSLVAEIRQAGEGLAGEFLYDTDTVISATGKVRKERIQPRCFQLRGECSGPGNQFDSWLQRAATCQQEGRFSRAEGHSEIVAVQSQGTASNQLRCRLPRNVAEQDGDAGCSAVLRANTEPHSTSAVL